MNNRPIADPRVYVKLKVCTCDRNRAATASHTWLTIAAASSPLWIATSHSPGTQEPRPWPKSRSTRLASDSTPVRDLRRVPVGSTELCSDAHFKTSTMPSESPSTAYQLKVNVNLSEYVSLLTATSCEVAAAIKPAQTPQSSQHKITGNNNESMCTHFWISLSRSHIAVLS